MTARRTMPWLAVAIASLAAAALWSWTYLAASGEEAVATAADLAAARRSAWRIDSMRRGASLSGAQRPEREVRRRIEDAAERSGIAAAGLETIHEQSGRRVGDTGYTERPTHVVVRDVSLQQAITFFHDVAEDSPGITVKSVRLAAPRENDTADRWTAEVTLTHLSPTQLAPASRRLDREAAAGGAE